MQHNIKPWQMRIAVRYADEDAKAFYQPVVRSFLDSLALMKGVQCVWVSEPPLFDELGVPDPLQGLYTAPDLVCLRSRRNAIIDRKGFAHIVGEVCPHTFGNPALVTPLYQKFLKKLPFPEQRATVVRL